MSLMLRRMRGLKIENLLGFGASSNTRDYRTHVDDRDVLTREKVKRMIITQAQLSVIQDFAHDKQDWAFDQDPQGMGMPFKEYVIDDSVHHLVGRGGRRVLYEFPNGYGASVVMGDLFHTDEEHPYEIGIMHNGKLVYDALDAESEDVMGYQTDEELMIVLAKLINLPRK